MSDTGINYGKFPFISIADFEYAEIDAVKLDNDEGYFAMINFFVDEPVWDAELNQSQPLEGMIFDTPIYGETLEELFHKTGLLFACGLFDELNVSAHGNLWDTQGEIIDSICWLHEGGVDVDHDHDEEVPEKKPTLH